MEENALKKNMLIVFFVVSGIFLFLYKGLILKGDEYREQYLIYRNQLPKSKTLKPRSIEVPDEPTKKFEQHLITKVNNNLYNEFI